VHAPDAIDQQFRGGLLLHNATTAQLEGLDELMLVVRCGTTDAMATTFEVIGFSHAQPAVSRPRRGSRLQFWTSTIMGCLFLILGTWVMYTVEGLGSESLEGQCSAQIATVLWLCVPTFAYFAWQGWRQTKPAAVREHDKAVRRADRLADARIDASRILEA